MTVVHVVQFQFKELIPTEEVKSVRPTGHAAGWRREWNGAGKKTQHRTGKTDTGQICDSMLALRDNCIHPTSNKAYVKSIAGGLDNSPEGIQGSITHVFVVEFESAADRDYYVHKDPAHLAFIEEAGPAILKARVVDFTPGVF